MLEHKMVEDWIASGRPTFWIVNRLTSHGLSAEEAAQIVGVAEASFISSKRRRLFLYRCVGIFMLLSGGGLTVLGMTCLDGVVIVSGAAFAIALVGFIITLEPKALESINRMLR